MEFITLTALSAFVSACLKKAGEKFSEKAVEAAFGKRKELAESFTELFKPELIQLGLNNPVTPDEITRELNAKPEVVEHASLKLRGDADSFKELIAVLREAAHGPAIINNFANQTNEGNSVNVVGDNTKISF